MRGSNLCARCAGREPEKTIPESEHLQPSHGQAIARRRRRRARWHLMMHVEYQGQQALVRIDTLEVIRGALPRRAHALLIEWALLHRTELATNWQAAQDGEPMQPIAPLE